MWQWVQKFNPWKYIVRDSELAVTRHHGRLIYRRDGKVVYDGPEAEAPADVKKEVAVFEATLREMMQKAEDKLINDFMRRGY